MLDDKMLVLIVKTMQEVTISDFLSGSYECSNAPLNPQSLFTNGWMSSSEGSPFIIGTNESFTRKSE